MAKGNLRLISARIDEDSYERMEALCKKYPYWKKNFIIREILYTVLKDFDESVIYDMLRKPHRTRCKVKCEYIYPYYGEDSTK